MPLLPLVLSRPSLLRRNRRADREEWAFQERELIKQVQAGKLQIEQLKQKAKEAAQIVRGGELIHLPMIRELQAGRSRILESQIQIEVSTFTASQIVYRS